MSGGIFVKPKYELITIFRSLVDFGMISKNTRYVHIRTLKIKYFIASPFFDLILRLHRQDRKIKTSVLEIMNQRFANTAEEVNMIHKLRNIFYYKKIELDELEFEFGKNIGCNHFKLLQRSYASALEATTLIFDKQLQWQQQQWQAWMMILNRYFIFLWKFGSIYPIW